MTTSGDRDGDGEREIPETPRSPILTPTSGDACDSNGTLEGRFPDYPQSSIRTPPRIFANPIFRLVDSIRHPENNDNRASLEPPFEPNDDEYCTDFHTACRKAHSLAELQAQFDATTQFDATALENIQTGTGKNCLHLLSLNDDLILSIQKGDKLNGRIMKSIDPERASQLVDFIVDKMCLLEEDERCLLLESDFKRRIPFQETLEKWVVSVEDKKKVIFTPTPRRASISSNFFGSDPSPHRSQLFSSQETNHAFCSLYLLSEIMQRLESKVKQKVAPFLNWRDEKRHAKKSPSKRHLFGRMLSNSSSISRNIYDVTNDDLPYLTKVFEQFSEIDNLIKTLLTVVIDKDEREAIFNLFLIENVMIQENNIAPWIIEMLDSPLQHTRINVIDYLKRLSSLTEQKRTYSDNIQLDELDALAKKLGGLHGFIPSMMALTIRRTEHAATIPLITRALDKKMTSPFVACTLFFDIFVLCVFLTAFRFVVDDFILGIPLKSLAYYLANVSIFYLVLRVWGKMISLFYFFKRYSILEFRVSKILIILNTSSVFLSWMCVWFMGYFESAGKVTSDVDLNVMRIVIAITTVLIWLHLIENLTFVNIKLATFVLAIRKITRDIFWYLVLLAGYGLCSSQILYTLMIPIGEKGMIPTGEAGEEEIIDCTLKVDGGRPSECYTQFYYSKVYATVLGIEEWGFGIDDVELSESFYRTLFSEVVYGILSFLFIIVLLNSLIAVISDSYERCLLQSKQLFGRARIRFLGDTLAFQNLFVNLENPGQRRWTHGGCTFLVTSTIIYVGFVFFELTMIKNVDTFRNDFWEYSSFAMNAWSLICFNVILAQQVEARAEKNFVGVCTRLFSWPINILQGIIRLLQGRSIYYISPSDGSEEWSGRVSYLKREMIRVGEEHAKQVSNLNLKIKKSEEDIVELLRTQQREVLCRLEALEGRPRGIEVE